MHSLSAHQRPILIVQHAETETPSTLLRALHGGWGIPYLWVHPYRGEPLPSVSEIAGLVSLGGPMGANDELQYPWITEELKLIERAVRSHLPFVGICLGGQLLARALGGKVEVHDHPEIGWHEVRRTREGKKDPYFSGFSREPRFFQWHNDTFFPPVDMTVLAANDHCERQAFQASPNAYGFQFHPEVDAALLKIWLCTEARAEVAAAQEHPHPNVKHSVQDPYTLQFLAEEAALDGAELIGRLSFLFTPRFESHSGIGFQSGDRVRFHERGEGSIFSAKVRRVFLHEEAPLVILEDGFQRLWPLPASAIISQENG